MGKQGRNEASQLPRRSCCAERGDEKDWFNAFVRESLGSLYFPVDNGFLEPNCILIRTGLVLDETGQLAKKLLEWLREEKGNDNSEQGIH